MSLISSFFVEDVDSISQFNKCDSIKSNAIIQNESTVNDIDANDKITKVLFTIN